MNVETWDIDKLELFFRNNDLPEGSIRLDSCSVITDVPLFIKSHLDIVKAQHGKQRYLPYLHRLQEFRRLAYMQLNNVTNNELFT